MLETPPTLGPQISRRFSGANSPQAQVVVALCGLQGLDGEARERLPRRAHHLYDDVTGQEVADARVIRFEDILLMATSNETGPRVFTQHRRTTSISLSLFSASSLKTGYWRHADSLGVLKFP